MIIGFAGLAGSGKTTAARMLEEEADFVRLPFAGPLKAMGRAFGLTPHEMAGDLKEAPCAALCGRTPRQFLQALGTDFGRNMIGENVWVEAWRRAVEKERLDAVASFCEADPPFNIVVDDVRFPNEVAAIEAMGGVVVRIDRPGAGSASGAGHPSEDVEALGLRQVIVNDDVEVFLADVLRLVRCAQAVEDVRRATHGHAAA